MNDQLLDDIVNFINSQVDLPFLNEEAEKSLFKALLIIVFQLVGAKAAFAATQKKSAAQ